jgi:hypothetical protein
VHCHRAGQHPLAEEWTGGTWTTLNVPDPGTSGDLVELNSVSCTSATFRSAVGFSSATATGVVSPLAETWNGSTWSLQTAAG